MIKSATQNFNLFNIFSLKNKAFHIPGIWLIFSLTILCAGYSKAEAPTLIKTKDISVLIPEQFEVQSHPSAILFLSHKNQGFPTFNVIMNAGEWAPAASSLSNRGQQLENEYHLIGLKNARLKSIKETIIDNYPATFGQLEFENDSIKSLSKVWIVSFPDRHYILTAVFNQPVSDQAAQAIDDLLKNLSFPGTVKVSSKGDNSGSQSTSGLTAKSVVLPIILIAGLYFVIKSWRPKRENKR